MNKKAHKHIIASVKAHNKARRLLDKAETRLQAAIAAGAKDGDTFDLPPGVALGEIDGVVPQASVILRDQFAESVAWGHARVPRWKLASPTKAERKARAEIQENAK